LLTSLDPAVRHLQHVAISIYKSSSTTPPPQPSHNLLSSLCIEHALPVRPGERLVLQAELLDEREEDAVDELVALFGQASKGRGS
jgi:hypothetical protein